MVVVENVEVCCRTEEEASEGVVEELSHSSYNRLNVSTSLPVRYA